MGKKPIRALRNVLGLPDEPLLPVLEETEVEASLLQEFSEAMKVAKTIRHNVKWSEVRHLKKAEKVKLVEEFYMRLPAEDLERHKKAQKLKKYLAIGFNAVARNLERNEVACCLIHGQAKPKMLITNLVQLARNKGVPVLVVNGLKQTMIESMGIESLAIGFLKYVPMNEKHEFYEVCMRIISLSKEISKDLEERADKTSDDKNKTEVIRKKKKSANTFDYKSLYLYRTSSDYRVFHPPNDESMSDEASAAEEVSISDEVGKMKISKRKLEEELLPGLIPNEKTNYIEPNILRVQSNPDKVRKKKKSK